MSKKIFFFDIDGTLADQEDILPSNQKALRELRLKGHTVMIASGRPAGYIRHMFSGLADGFSRKRQTHRARGKRPAGQQLYRRRTERNH